MSVCLSASVCMYVCLCLSSCLSVCLLLRTFLQTVCFFLFWVWFFLVKISRYLDFMFSHSQMVCVALHSFNMHRICIYRNDFHIVIDVWCHHSAVYNSMQMLTWFKHTHTHKIVSWHIVHFRPIPFFTQGSPLSLWKTVFEHPKVILSLKPEKSTFDRGRGFRTNRSLSSSFSHSGTTELVYCSCSCLYEILNSNHNNTKYFCEK